MEKSLYYYNSGDKFIFASEIKSILRHQIKRIANKKIISDYLYFSMLNHTDETFFKGIKCISPAHNAFFDEKSKLELAPFYKINFTDSDHSSISKNLYNSTKLRLVSDVPVSISLSGGIDSSVISSIVAKINPSNTSAFTLDPGKNKVGYEVDNAQKLVDVYFFNKFAPQSNL